MSEVKINKAAYDAQVVVLREKYNLAFPSESANMVSYSRPTYIARYARDIRFWSEHLPDVELEELDSELLARHAVCSNAKGQLWATLIKAGVTQEEIEAAIA